MTERERERDVSTSTLQILKVYIECVIIGRICETDFGVCKNAAFINAAYIIYCYSVDLWLSDYKKKMSISDFKSA